MSEQSSAVASQFTVVETERRYSLVQNQTRTQLLTPTVSKPAVYSTHHARLPTNALLKALRIITRKKTTRQEVRRLCLTDHILKCGVRSVTGRQVSDREVAGSTFDSSIVM